MYLCVCTCAVWMFWRMCARMDGHVCVYVCMYVGVCVTKKVAKEYHLLPHVNDLESSPSRRYCWMRLILRL